ncbi:MAG: ATP-grasp domain-containing protein, partial [Oscillospiraceae bacterium]
LAQLAQEVTEGMGDIPMPWFVKPAAEGSSFGVSRVQTPAQLPAALDTALRYGKKLVVEQGIRGFEVGCAIMGDAEKEDSLFVGAVDAIALEGGFFDFHEKYTLETAKILLPAPVEGAVAEKIIETARRLYRLFGCRGLARVDLFLSEAGEVIFNEINTLPGMTPHSRYPGMMRTAGLPFEAMLAKLLEQEA